MMSIEDWMSFVTAATQATKDVIQALMSQKKMKNESSTRGLSYTGRDMSFYLKGISSASCLFSVFKSLKLIGR